MTTQAAVGGTQAVDRAAALLTYVVEADHPVTFAEAIEAAGLARSTTSRLLSALERTQLLERSSTGEYVGGPLFVRYAARHDRNKQLAKLATADARGGRPRHRRVGAPRGQQRRPGRPHRAGRHDLPARRPRLDRRRDPAALLGTRQGAARLGGDRPAGRAAGRTHRAHPAQPHRPRGRPRGAPATAATPPPATSSRSASPASRLLSSAPRSSRRWASPGPAPGSRDASRSSVSSSSTGPRCSPSSCSTASTQHQNKNARKGKRHDTR